MSEGLYSHTTRSVGTILTASIYNADHQNHITNQNPSMTGGLSDDVAQMQAMTDPGDVGSESLAGSLAGEIERIRFVLDRIVGGTHWYEAPSNSLASAHIPPGCWMGFWGATLPSGWLWANGLTIGDGSSGGTARANADTEDLFTVLWNSMTNTEAPVSGGRGASAAADFAAHKTITLPDMCGRVAAGQDDMGGVASKNRLTGQSGGVNADTLGAAGGAETHTLNEQQLASHDHGRGSLTTSIAGSHSHTIALQPAGQGDPGAAAALMGVGSTSTSSAGSHDHDISGSTAEAGSDVAHNNVQPTIITNFIIKL